MSGNQQPTMGVNGAPTMGVGGQQIGPMAQQQYMDPMLSAQLARGSINELTGQPTYSQGVLPGVGTGPGWTPEGGGDWAGIARAPGAGGGGMGIQPVPMNLQMDPAYGQHLQFPMKSALPQRNRLHSNGLLAPGAMRVDPAYAGQPTMPAMTSLPAPIGRIRGR